MNNATKIAMVSALALATALPATAQQYRPTQESQRQQEDYQAQRRQYDAQRQQYEDSRDDYRETSRNYREARRDYERRLAEWNRARQIYDRRYGSGAYARMYQRPTWDQNYWSRYETPPYAGYYGRNAAARFMCDDKGDNSQVTAGVIGALAGAMLGSSVAGRGSRTEGAVLGGVVGAAVGAAVGHSKDKYRCDSRGPYFTYDETVPYREGRNRYSSAYDSSYYSRQQCRLAAAPVDAYGRDVRYVRVCPDGQGRYRITG